jgi:hypothetical protein
VQRKQVVCRCYSFSGETPAACLASSFKKNTGANHPMLGVGRHAAVFNHAATQHSAKPTTLRVEACLRTLDCLSHGGSGDIVPLNDLTLEWQHLEFSLERIRTAPDDASMRRIASIPLSGALEVNGGKRSGGVDAGGVFRVQG